MPHVLVHMNPATMAIALRGGMGPMSQPLQPAGAGNLIYHKALLLVVQLYSTCADGNQSSVASVVSKNPYQSSSQVEECDFEPQGASWLHGSS
jgi:hypothetical protein